MSSRTAPVAGLLLSAGGGSRLGLPKGLLREPDGTPRIARVCAQMRDVGCDPVVVVLGAAAEEVAALLPDFVLPVLAEDWEQGMGESLRAGLGALTGAETADLADAALVMLVDLPDVGEAAFRRVIDHGCDCFPELGTALIRATWTGQPGHPVLLGRAHWQAAAQAAVGDQGARALLSGPGAVSVECGDLGTGADIDRPEDDQSFLKVRRADS